MSDNLTSINGFDKINPKHYKEDYEIEVIEIMRKVFGDEEVAIHCKLNAFKYRMRMGKKPNESIETDLAKERWYLDKKNELKDSLHK